jgi:hypothetical protein
MHGHQQVSQSMVDHYYSILSFITADIENYDVV